MAFLMCIHNVCFHGEMRKIAIWIPILSNIKNRDDVNGSILDDKALFLLLNDKT